MGESMANALRYHIEVDLSQKDSPHAQLIRLTGRNKDVLEVGPATGYVTKVLQQRGCRVSCVEMDPEAAEVAAEFCERMIVGNIEEVDFSSAFRKQRFDVVTFGDVLEHLVDPMGVLTRVREILTPTGYVVASVPNIAHSSIRLSLLRGQFQYTEKGLLDRTHLRFFTEESLGALFRDAGYQVRSLRRILVDPFATELELREDDYPSNLREASRVDVQGLTYQFVVRAYPATSTSNGRALNIPANGTGGNLVDDLSRRQNELQDALRATEGALGEARDALAATNRTLLERDALIAERDRLAQELNAQLEAISGAFGYRLLESYRKRIRRLFPSEAWWGMPYRSLVRAVRRTANARRTRDQSESAGKKDRRP
jgi:2-polyprenyl-3-methyl-5-hydroxy-6-metoxy-1,4-benzoquinol methylase